MSSGYFDMPLLPEATKHIRLLHGPRASTLPRNIIRKTRLACNNGTVVRARGSMLGQKFCVA